MKPKPEPQARSTPAYSGNAPHVPPAASDRLLRPEPASPLPRPSWRAIRRLLPLLALTLLPLPPTLAAQEKRGLQKVTTDTASGRIELTVQVQARAGRLLRTLEAGAALRTGDLIQFVLAVDKPAFVYVVQVFADGSAQVLYPEQADVRLQPELETRIPEAGAWYQLDDVTGEEHLYFLASARPLAEVDRTLYETVEGLRTEGLRPPPARPSDEDPPPATVADANPPQATDQATQQATEPPAASPPPAKRKTIPSPSPFGLGTRGLVKTVPDATAQVVSDEAGLAIYHFWFEHRPKPELDG